MNADNNDTINLNNYPITMLQNRFCLPGKQLTSSSSRNRGKFPSRFTLFIFDMKIIGKKTKQLCCIHPITHLHFSHGAKSLSDTGNMSDNFPEHLPVAVADRGGGAREPCPPTLLRTTFFAPLELNKYNFLHFLPHFAQHIISVIFC